VNTALWILAGILSAAFLVGGGTLLVLTKERYRSLGSNQYWVDDFGPGHLKAIGALKVVGAAGLVLPTIGGVAPGLVPLASSGLMLVMAGAGTTRFRRSEWASLAGDLVFLSLFAFLAWGRFGLEPFT
jgi:hypothetical protein